MAGIYMEGLRIIAFSGGGFGGKSSGSELILVGHLKGSSSFQENRWMFG